MRWQKYTPSEFVRLPKSAGVYVVFSRGRIVYVGFSQNVLGRVFFAHRLRPSSDRMETPWGLASGVTIKVRLDSRYGEGLMREARLIRRLAPPNNLRHVVHKGHRSPRRQYTPHELAILRENGKRP